MFAALLSALLWLPLASSSFSADTIYADSTRTRASPAVKQAFWARASSLAGGLADGAVLRNDSSLPPLPGNLRRVALCITGGARSLALPRFGIPELWARNVVGGLAANETHAYYVLDTEFKAPKKGKRRGLRSHPDTQDWSVDWTELGRIFSILQPKAVHVVRAQSESRCGVSYLQFAKMAQCLEMIYETELLQGWRYDYVVRLRPDTQILSPFPPVQGLKRAIYTPACVRAALAGNCAAPLHLAVSRPLPGPYMGRQSSPMCSTIFSSSPIAPLRKPALARRASRRWKRRSACLQRSRPACSSGRLRCVGTTCPPARSMPRAPIRSVGCEQTLRCTTRRWWRTSS